MQFPENQGDQADGRDQPSDEPSSPLSSFIGIEDRRLFELGGPGPVENQRLRSFDVDDHLGELAPHQWFVDERPTERPPLPGVAERLHQGTSRITQPEQGDTEPRSVGQLHHPTQSLAVRRTGLTC